MNKLRNLWMIFLAIIIGCSIILTGCDTTDTPKKEMCTVIFDTNAGDDNVENEPDIIRVEKGKTVPRPSIDPSREGYTFEGWYDNEECEGDEFDFSTPITAKTFVLYAKWSVKLQYYTVIFDLNGGDGDNVSVQIESGSTVEPLKTTPVRSGYVFGGWFLEPEGITPYNFGDAVTTNFTLYAKWTQSFSVIFHLNYEGAPAAMIQEVNSGETPTRPDNPTREGYSFAGWFTDPDFNNPYEFGAVTASIQVYAKWVNNEGAAVYQVEFDLNYSGAPENIIQNVVEGAVINQPDVSREGHRFVGWFTDSNFVNEFTLNTPVTNNTYLYAKWIETYLLTINYNYSGAPEPITKVYDKNSPITVPASPSRIGYVFAGWSDSSNGIVGFDFEEGISSDTTVYAQWSKQYIFEAEMLDFSDFFGWGFSGNATGTDAILQDIDGSAGASNGYFVTYLYGYGVTLTFEIDSDRAIPDVELVLRLSGEIKDFFIQSTLSPGGSPDEEPVYTVKVNGVPIQYEEIYFNGVPGQNEGIIMPFEDFVIANIDLVEGKNTIELITDNSLGMGGTMWSTAPMVDCIKLTTYANLTWDPVEGNY